MGPAPVERSRLTSYQAGKNDCGRILKRHFHWHVPRPQHASVYFVASSWPAAHFGGGRIFWMEGGMHGDTSLTRSAYTEMGVREIRRHPSRGLFVRSEDTLPVVSSRGLHRADWKCASGLIRLLFHWNSRGLGIEPMGVFGLFNARGGSICIAVGDYGRYQQIRNKSAGNKSAGCLRIFGFTAPYPSM
jgi:hypothetical protein